MSPGRPPKLTVDVQLDKVQRLKQQQKGKKKRTYSTRMTKERGNIRDMLTADLRAVTGDETAQMWWNAEDFYSHVASTYRVALVGWPPDLLFANLSRVRGGIRVIRDLSERIEGGTLRFVAIPPDQARELTVDTAAPGNFIPRPPRAIRRDYGKQRVLPWLRLSRPPRKMRMGPKSAEYVEDSDADA